MKAVLALIALLGTTPALAEGGATPDPRMASLPLVTGGVVAVTTSPDTMQTILFAPGERILSVILSDPQAYFVSVSGGGDSLTLRANGAGALAMMSVRTDARAYDFELVANRGARVPVMLRIDEPAPPPTPAVALPGPPPGAAVRHAYSLAGDQLLLPETVSDDGRKTYITWGEAQAIPATFALDAQGEEHIVDGHMRGGVYTIDRVHDRLVFRIDRWKASARRNATPEVAHAEQ